MYEQGEGGEFRRAFFYYGGDRLYLGIGGSYAKEKKYCAAYEHLKILSSAGVKIDPMPPHPGTLMIITREHLIDIETSLGIFYSFIQGNLCAVAEVAFGVKK